MNRAVMCSQLCDAMDDPGLQLQYLGMQLHCWSLLLHAPPGVRWIGMRLQVCDAIFDQGNALQNAGERRHLLAPAGSGGAGDEVVCDGRIQASRPPLHSPSWPWKCHKNHLLLCPLCLTLPVPDSISHADRP